MFQMQNETIFGIEAKSDAREAIVVPSSAVPCMKIIFSLSKNPTTHFQVWKTAELLVPASTLIRSYFTVVTASPCTGRRRKKRKVKSLDWDWTSYWSSKRHACSLSLSLSAVASWEWLSCSSSCYFYYMKNMVLEWVLKFLTEKSLFISGLPRNFEKR